MSRCVKNAHFLSYLLNKTASNLFIQVGTTMVFTGILEDVWPVNNQKKMWLCDFRCLRKSGITRFSNTSITVYTSHLGGVCPDMEWLTTGLYNLWLKIGVLFFKIKLLPLNKLKTESCAGKGAPCMVRKITHLVHYHVVLS